MSRTLQSFTLTQQSHPHLYGALCLAESFGDRIREEGSREFRGYGSVDLNLAESQAAAGSFRDVLSLSVNEPDLDFPEDSPLWELNNLLWIVTL